MNTQLEICVSATNIDAEGARRIYEDSFPEIELFPWEQYLPYFEDGYALLHVTRENGRVVTMSVVECLEDKFLLAYIATDERCRNRGIGAKHIDGLREQLAEKNPNAVIYLEVEDPEEAELSEEERTIRQRRKSWYEGRHNAQTWTGRYRMPFMTDKRRNIPARLLALAPRAVAHQEFVDAAVEIMVTSYELNENHQLVNALKKQK